MTKSARHGQKQEKEKYSDYWIEEFPFEKFFRRKITIGKLDWDQGCQNKYLIFIDSFQ